MRAAVITQVKTVSNFSNRVYQAYAAPVGVVKPYAVVKFVDDLKDLTNKYGSIKEIQVFIYEVVGKLSSLDDIEIKVRKALHNVDLYTDDSTARMFRCEFQQTIGDIKDDVLGLVFKRMDFIIIGARA